MKNALKELNEHVGKRTVEYIYVQKGNNWRDDCKIIRGSLEEVKDDLSYDYDNGYGGQELFGFIWYKDGTYSERGEYDGAEWWEHKSRPQIPNEDEKIDF